MSDPLKGFPFGQSFTTEDTPGMRRLREQEAKRAQEDMMPTPYWIQSEADRDWLREADMECNQQRADDASFIAACLPCDDYSLTRLNRLINEYDDSDELNELIRTALAIRIESAKQQDIPMDEVPF